MSNPISFNELFDLSGMEAAYKQLLTAEKEFSSSATKDLTILAKSVQNLRVDMEKLVREFEAYSIATDKGSKKLKELIEQKDKAIKAYREQTAAMEANRKVQDEVSSSINKLKEENKKLTAALLENKNSTALSKIEAEKLAKAKLDLKNKTNEEALALKVASSQMNIAAGSYDEANKRAQALLRTIKSTEGGFESTSPAIQQNIKDYQALSAQLLKFEQQLGINYRNVGNYRSAFNGLSFSLTQITRELPAFTNSFQTGLMGISNNIPIFVDEVVKLKNANADLVAEGKKPVSILSSLGSALFSWNTVISLAITGLTVFGPKLFELAKGLFTSKDAFDSARESIKLYAKAFEDSNYLSAIKDVNSLRQNIKLYHDGLLSGKAVVEQYNESIGKTAGAIKNVDQAEKFLMQNSNAYIKMMYLKAAATLANEEAAKVYVEQQKLQAERDKSIAEQRAKIDKEEIEAIKQLEFLRRPENSANQDRLITERRAYYAKEREKINTAELNAEITDKENQKNAFVKIVDNTYKQIGQIASENKFNIFGNSKLDDKELKSELEKLQKMLDETYSKMMDASVTGKAIPQELINKYNELSEKINNAKSSLDLLLNYEGFKLEAPQFDQQQFEQETKDLEETMAVSEENLRNIIIKADDKLSAERTRNREKDYQSAMKFAKKIGADSNKIYKEFLASGYKTFAEFEEAKTEKVNEQEKKRKAIREATINTIYDVGNAIFDIQRNFNQKEIDDARDTLDYKLSLIGNNAEAKKQAEIEYQNTLKKLQVEQAKRDKAQALFNIGLNTAVAIMKALTTEGGLALSIYAGIQGAIQAAIVASKPIPKFAVGTQNSPEGVAIVGEQGRELIKEPSGKERLTGDKAELTYLPKGSRVYTATQTKQLLERREVTQRLNQYEDFSTQLSNRAIEYEMMKQKATSTNNITVESMEKAFSSSMSKLPLQVFNLDESGYRRAIKKGNSTVVIRNKRRES